MIISTNGIVLKTILYSDSSIIVRLFTEDYGKIAIIAKGARKPKNPVSGILEPTNHLNIQYYNKENRSIQIFKEANFLSKFNFIRGNYKKLSISLAIIDALDKSTIEYNPSPILYRLAWKILEKINSTQNNPMLIFSFFLMQLSIRIGFMPELDKCYKCKNFVIDGGIDYQNCEIICRNCLIYKDYKLNSKTMLLLKDLTLTHIDKLELKNYNNHYISESILFLKLFTFYHIEGIKNMKSMSTINQISNG